MLSMLSSLRRIKPSVADVDYKAGDVIGETPQQKSVRLTNSVYLAIKASPHISVKETIKVTGLTQGGCHGMLARLSKKGLIKFVPENVPYANKPANFYSLTEG